MDEMSTNTGTKRIGRPPLENPMSEIVAVRLTKEEMAAFRRLVASEGRAETPAAFLRLMIQRRLHL